MSLDPFYQRCCITGAFARNVKIDWHHNLQYGGRQVQEKWCILPLAKPIHDKIETYKRQCDWIMLNRATDEELARYSKVVDLRKKRERLNEEYGTPKR